MMIIGYDRSLNLLLVVSLTATLDHGLLKCSRTYPASSTFRWTLCLINSALNWESWRSAGRIFGKLRGPTIASNQPRRTPMATATESSFTLNRAADFLTTSALSRSRRSQHGHQVRHQHPEGRADPQSGWRTRHQTRTTPTGMMCGSHRWASTAEGAFIPMRLQSNLLHSLEGHNPCGPSA